MTWLFFRRKCDEESDRTDRADRTTATCPPIDLVCFISPHQLPETAGLGSRHFSDGGLMCPDLTAGDCFAEMITPSSLFELFSLHETENKTERLQLV